MKEFDKLVEIMATLRDKKLGCPWDIEQDHNSLVPFLIEETYETVDAIEDGIPKKICEELGDLLLQIIFHAQVAKENGEFEINDVIRGISNKLIRRHPHVFGDSNANTPEEVIKQWNEIKNEEKENGESSPTFGIGRNLPSLQTAYNQIKFMIKKGLIDKDIEKNITGMEKELTRIKENLKSNENTKIKDKIGDMLFQMIELTVIINADPELALRSSIKRHEASYINKQKEDLIND